MPLLPMLIPLLNCRNGRHRQPGRDQRRRDLPAGVRAVDEEVVHEDDEGQVLHPPGGRGRAGQRE